MRSLRASATVRIEDRLARGGPLVACLHAPALAFGWIADLRGALYERGLLPAVRVPAPVVSVGNVTTGGSGKTPMCAWLAQRLAAQGRRVGLLSRGWGAAPGERWNDEARLLARAAPDAQQVQDRDRVRGALALVDRGVDVIVLDDGFQHRRLARDLDLVLIDATAPWGLPGRSAGNAPLLPRGLLRERPTALKRASAVVLTRVDQASPAELVTLRAELAELAPQAPIACAVHRPSALRTLAGALRPLEALRGSTLDCVSGLAAPQAFERTLEALGARLAQRRRFPDHHRYASEDLAGLGAGGRPIVTSAKDAAKLEALAIAREVWVLEVQLEFVAGLEPLAAMLDALAPSRAGRERAALHEGLHG